MGYRKVDMLAKIQRISAELAETFDREGIKVKPLYYTVAEDADKHIARVREAHQWMSDIEAFELLEVRKIYGLLKPEIWARYRSWGGFEEHREMKMLSAALAALRTKVISRQRPDFFKRPKPVKKKKESAE